MVILYIIYNSPLIETTDHLKVGRVLITGFIDDVAMLARGVTLQEANAKIVRLMEEEDGAMEWVAQANCKFEMDKFALMGFTHRQIL